MNNSGSGVYFVNCPTQHNLQNFLETIIQQVEQQRNIGPSNAQDLQNNVDDSTNNRSRNNNGHRINRHTFNGRSDLRVLQGTQLVCPPPYSESDVVESPPGYCEIDLGSDSDISDKPPAYTDVVK